MNKGVEVGTISEVHQEDDSAVFGREGLGGLEKIGNNWQLKYNEKNKAGDAEIKLLIESNELVIQRGDIEGDHTLMEFEPGEKQECKVMAAGK